ncbi:MAG: helix-turn-helix domain-containing protein [Acutalibacteraceae bacterium]
MLHREYTERIKNLMNEERISQAELARSVGISQSAVCNWLNGKKEPSIDSLWRLADFFDVSVDYIIGRKEI